MKNTKKNKILQKNANNNLKNSLTGGFMFKILFLILSLSIYIYAIENPNLIARDSGGIIIEIKEKYGSFTTDTCTAVLLFNDNFVVVHKEQLRGSDWYPESFHSIRVLKHLKK